MKNIIKLFFYLLFIPYIFIILFGVISAIGGIDVGFFGEQRIYYGKDAYEVAFIFTFFGRWYIWVSCLVVQIVLLILEKVKNKGFIRFCILSLPIVYIVLPLLGYGLSLLVV